MSIVQRVRGLIADAHEHGYASELPESVQKVLHAIAEHVEGAVHGAAPSRDDLKTLIEHLLGERLKTLVDGVDIRIAGQFDASVLKLQGLLTESVQIAFEQLKQEVGSIVEAKFTDLLATAAAADGKPANPAAAPAEPAPQA